MKFLTFRGLRFLKTARVEYMYTSECKLKPTFQHNFCYLRCLSGFSQQWYVFLKQATLDTEMRQSHFQVFWGQSNFIVSTKEGSLAWPADWLSPSDFVFFLQSGPWTSREKDRTGVIFNVQCRRVSTSTYYPEKTKSIHMQTDHWLYRLQFSPWMNGNL